MSRIAPAPVADEVTTPRLRDRLRANRGLLLVGVLVLVGALLLALAQSSRQRGFLDPQAVDPSGSAALATILEEQGVRVVRVTDHAQPRVDELEKADGAGDAARRRRRPRLSEQMLALVAATDHTRTVLVTPYPETLEVLAPWAAHGDADGRRPTRCRPPAAGTSRSAPDRCPRPG